MTNSVILRQQIGAVDVCSTFEMQQALSKTATQTLLGRSSKSLRPAAQKVQTRLYQGGSQYERGNQFSKYSFPVHAFDEARSHKGNTGTKTFAYLVVGSGAAIGATAGKSLVQTILGSLAPASDVLALANVELDISPIPEGVTTTFQWRGKPIFVKHRTQAEIDRAQSEDNVGLPDPAKDETRIKKPEWLVLIGICTHLGCVPLSNAGDYGGWFCPCHGSHYDTSGRIRQGPAPYNLEVPPYCFIEDEKVLVGLNDLSEAN